MSSPDPVFPAGFPAGAFPPDSTHSNHVQRRRWLASLLLAFGLFAVLPRAAVAAAIRGRVLDPSGRAVAGAQVSVLNSLNAVIERRTDGRGRFAFPRLSPGEYQMVARRPGFAANFVKLTLKTGESRSLTLHLKLSAVAQQVVVSASLSDSLATQIGSSVSVISRSQMADQGDQFLLDALRQVPGVAVNQTGRQGGVTSVFIRGGSSDYSLVMLDGVPMNEFGGAFDFAPLLADGVEELEVDRGPESALYGPDAVAGVINVVTAEGDGPPHFTVLGEGGSHDAWRTATGGSGLTRGWGWAYDLARYDDNGVVPNDDYRDQSALLSLNLPRTARRQIDFHFYGNANNAGAPGAFGSDPDHLFTGTDRISRDKQNMFGYGFSYAGQFTQRFRQTVSLDLSTNDYYFISPYGDSYSNNLNGVVDTLSEFSVSPKDFLVGGFEYGREQIKDSFIANAGGTPFLLPRSRYAVFAENRWSPTPRLYVIAGARLDSFSTGALPADPSAGRPFLPSNSITKADPRVSAAYLLHGLSLSPSRIGLTRLHASFGTGIRMPSGFDLAFTNNGRLQPEESVSFDSGIEQRFFSDRAILDATYFYNRFEDQIVVLGGTLTHLSTFTSANLGNSRAEGAEISFRFEPTRSIEAQAQYTLTSSALLALTGASVALSPFHAGQPLLRIPRNSASYSTTWRHGRLMLNANASFRGSTLDLEPNDGTYACELGLPCLFTDKGYQDVNGGFSYRLPKGLEIYGRLYNLLNESYEESLGFPALKLNFMAGLRITFPGK
jgi:outer membrane receptor protein involved in Fe transport